MSRCILYLYTPPPLPSFSRWNSRVFTLNKRILFTFKFVSTVPKNGRCPLSILSSNCLLCVQMEGVVNLCYISVQMGRCFAHFTCVHSASLYFRPPQLWLILKTNCNVRLIVGVFLVTIVPIDCIQLYGKYDGVDWGAITGFDVMDMDLAGYDLLVRLLSRLLRNDWTMWIRIGVRPSKWWLYLSCLCWLELLWFRRQMLINKNHLFFRTLRLWLWPFGRSWSWTRWSWRRPELFFPWFFCLFLF